MKSLTDLEKIRLEKLRILPLGVQPLEDNLKRIEQSKGKELKEFAIHLAKQLEDCGKELYKSETTIKESNQKEFRPEHIFKNQICELAYKLKYKEYKNKRYQGEIVTRKNSLKIALSWYFQVSPPDSIEFILLKRWYKEIEIGTDLKPGILKYFNHFCDRKKK